MAMSQMERNKLNEILRGITAGLEEMEALLGRSGPDYRQVLHNALTLMTQCQIL